MKIKRKTVTQLLLSKRELDLLFEMAEKARTGQTVHYAENEMAPGVFFGVGVGEEHDSRNEPLNRFPKEPSGKKY